MKRIKNLTFRDCIITEILLKNEKYEKKHKRNQQKQIGKPKFS